MQHIIHMIHIFSYKFYFLKLKWAKFRSVGRKNSIFYATLNHLLFFLKITVYHDKWLSCSKNTGTNIPWGIISLTAKGLNPGFPWVQEVRRKFLEAFATGQYLSAELLCPAGRIVAFDQTFILDRRARAGSLRARTEAQPWGSAASTEHTSLVNSSKANTPPKPRRSLEQSTTTRVDWHTQLRKARPKVCRIVVPNKSSCGTSCS